MWPPKLLTLGRSKPGSGKRQAWARKEASLGQGRGKSGSGKRRAWARHIRNLMDSAAGKDSDPGFPVHRYRDTRRSVEHSSAGF